MFFLRVSATLLRPNFAIVWKSKWTYSNSIWLRFNFSLLLHLGSDSPKTRTRLLFHLWHSLESWYITRYHCVLTILHLRLMDDLCQWFYIDVQQMGKDWYAEDWGKISLVPLAGLMQSPSLSQIRIDNLPESASYTSPCSLKEPVAKNTDGGNQIGCWFFVLFIRMHRPQRIPDNMAKCSLVSPLDPIHKESTFW